MNDATLVTGGAGYIGSHVVRQLVERRENVVVLDDLSTGSAGRVQNVPLVVGSIANADLVTDVLRRFDVRRVVHMAAKTRLRDSIRRPLEFYRENTVATQSLLECCMRCDVNSLVFTSTAAVYGHPDGRRSLDELHPAVPETPYGNSKLMTEQMLIDTSKATSLRHVSIRCFNVAGYHRDVPNSPPLGDGALLLDAACQTAIGGRECVYVFGTDHPTPDGTGVRDFVHVEDVANAHLLALDYLNNGGPSVTLNCGKGSGHSVMDVIRSVERISGVELCVRSVTARSGDLPCLVSNSTRIREVLGWRPNESELDSIISSALEQARRGKIMNEESRCFHYED